VLPRQASKNSIGLPHVPRSSLLMAVLLVLSVVSLVACKRRGQESQPEQLRLTVFALTPAADGAEPIVEAADPSTVSTMVVRRK
jgi:hypothetical protein